jgi:hypothetical protein
MGYSIQRENRGPCITYIDKVNFNEFMGAVRTVHTHSG